MSSSRLLPGYRCVISCRFPVQQWLLKWQRSLGPFSGGAGNGRSQSSGAGALRRPSAGARPPGCEAGGSPADRQDSPAILLTARDQIAAFAARSGRLLWDKGRGCLLAVRGAPHPGGLIGPCTNDFTAFTKRPSVTVVNPRTRSLTRPMRACSAWPTARYRS
jgi:hypothetical protein